MNEAFSPLAPAPAWEIVPGALDTAMLAFERRPGVLHCNTYLLKTPEYVLVIDPGADEAQSQATADAAATLQRELPRQAAVCLTHCHLDHCAAAGRALPPGLPEASIICHADGARALRERDPELTLATLTGLDFPTLPNIHPLFAGPGPSGVTRAMDTPGGGLRSLSIPIGPRDALQVYHTPGHSPDSLCYRVGGALFAGDLPFAAGPGLVDLPGWDAAQLQSSLYKILWLLDHCNITTVYPGHGRALPRRQARGVIAALLDDLHADTSFLSAEGKGFPPALLRAGSALLRQAGVGSGTELDDETFIAPTKDLQRQYCHDPASKTLHTRAARAALDLDRMFDSGALAEQRLLRRARRRLGDFLCALHGFRFADHAGAVEPNLVAATVLRDLSGLPLFKDCPLAFEHAASSPEARMDGEVLADLLETTLETLAQNGARSATLRVSADQDATRIEVAWTGDEARPQGTVHLYLRLSMEAYGGAFAVSEDHCTFTMPLAPKEDA